jgi:hypothetical protein
MDLDGKTPAAPASGAGRAAGLGVTPADTERLLDGWEEKVERELDDMRALWIVYAASLHDEAKKLRGERALDEAVDIETYIEHVEMLFIEARSELENEIQARLSGDSINMSIAARRVNEALSMLRAYAARWKEYVDALR